jgi:hypothetical protein
LLKDDEFLTWCKRLGFGDTTFEAVAKVRSHGPTRRVGGGRISVSGRYPSRKMGVTIQFESHKVELAFIYRLEHDSSVLEYYDQPPSIPLTYDASDGRRLAVLHTPDFFVIRKEAAGWEECKTEEDLGKLAERAPIGISGIPPVPGDVLQANPTRTSLASTIMFGPMLRSTGPSSKTSSSWMIISALIQHRSVRDPGRT